LGYKSGGEIKEMKKYILAIIITLFLVTGVSAAPFLGVDPDPDHSEYIIELDGIEHGPFAAVEDRGDVIIVFDFDTMLQSGETYSVRVLGINAWGDESEWSVPLEFALTGGGTVIERRQPDAPSVLRILSE
jgi:hypothetical protein